MANTLLDSSIIFISWASLKFISLLTQFFSFALNILEETSFWNENALTPSSLSLPFKPIERRTIFLIMKPPAKMAMYM